MKKSKYIVKKNKFTALHFLLNICYSYYFRDITPSMGIIKNAGKPTLLSKVIGETAVTHTVRHAGLINWKAHVTISSDVCVHCDFPYRCKNCTKNERVAQMVCFTIFEAYVEGLALNNRHYLVARDCRYGLKRL